MRTVIFPSGFSWKPESYLKATARDAGDRSVDWRACGVEQLMLSWKSRKNE